MKKLKQLIKQNKFDYVDSDITETNFPDNGRHLKDFKLFHFNRNISSENVVKEMEKEGYVPANIYELLEWKDWNDKDSIVALGSVWLHWNGYRSVAYLDSDGSRRRLNLCIWDGDWFDDGRFLAVRKSGTETLNNSDKVLERLEVLENFKIKVEKVLKV
jgi:hypothetical protein